MQGALVLVVALVAVYFFTQKNVTKELDKRDVMNDVPKPNTEKAEPVRGKQGELETILRDIGSLVGTVVKVVDGAVDRNVTRD